MGTIGAFEAKPPLSSQLERLAQRESFTIIRHGKPVAQLVPAQQRDPERTKVATRRMEELADGQILGGDCRDFRDAGRKW